MAKESTKTESGESTENQSSNMSVLALASELATERTQASGSNQSREPQAPEEEDDAREQSAESTEGPEQEPQAEQPEAEQVEGEVEGQGEPNDAEDEGAEDEPEDGESEKPATLHDEVVAILREVGAEPTRARALTKMAGRLQKSLRQRDEALAEVQELKQSGAGAVDISALLQNNDEQVLQIEAEVRQLSDGIDKLMAARETGVLVTKDGKELVLSQEEIDGHLKQWREALDERRIQRQLRRSDIERERQAVAAEARQVAAKHYAWVNDPKHDDYALAKAELRALGPVGRVLASVPQFNVIIGRYIAGLKSERAKAAQVPAIKAQASKLSGGRVPAPIGASRAVVPPRNNDEDSRRKEAAKRFEKTGRTSDLAKELAEEHEHKVRSRRK